MSKVNVFSQDLWESVRLATQTSFTSLLEYCRTGLPEISWHVELFSGGVMPFNIWLELRPMNSEVPEVRVGITYWGATQEITAEYEIWRDEDKLAGAELSPIPIGDDPQHLKEQLGVLSATLLATIWDHRERIRNSLLLGS